MGSCIRPLRGSAISISLETVISSLNISKEQKTFLYMRMCNFTAKDGEIVWEDNIIKGFKLYQPMESIRFTVDIK